MYPVVFNRKELCRLSIDEFENLKRVVPFWGLDWDEGSGELVGRLTSYSLRVIGLDRKEMRKLRQLLAHTGIRLIDEKRQDALTLSVFTAGSGRHPFAIETSSGHSFSFKLNDGPYTTTKEWVSKGIFLPDKSDEAKLHFSRTAETQKLEFVCYVVLQMFSQNSPEELDSVSASQYKDLLQAVLTPINPSLASFQLKAEWPTTPPIHPARSSEPSSTFDPFKSKDRSKATRIDPFKYKQNKKESKVINPFFKNKTP